MATLSQFQICSACLPDDLKIVHELFSDYIRSLDVDLSFQNVEHELAGLPGKYAPPEGMILIAWSAERKPVGIVALRPTSARGVCEMKRLYVKPAARGHVLGRRLAEHIIACAHDMGYKRMLLDTLASMQAAQKLYAEIGFRPTEPYYNNPLPGTVYLALEL